MRGSSTRRHMEICVGVAFKKRTSMQNFGYPLSSNSYWLQKFLSPQCQEYKGNAYSRGQGLEKEADHELTIKSP